MTDRAPITAFEDRIIAALKIDSQRTVAAQFGISTRRVENVVRRARAAGIIVTHRYRSPNARPWTPEEEAQVVEMHNAGASDEEIAAATGHTVSSCQTRLSRLKASGVTVVHHRNWTDSQCDMLVEMYEAGSSVAEISTAIGRSTNAVEARVKHYLEDGTLEPHRGRVRRQQPRHDPLLAALVATYGERRAS